MTPRKLAGGFKIDQALNTWHPKKKGYYKKDGDTPAWAGVSRKGFARSAFAGVTHCSQILTC